jgi:diguanylate cyclase (GGDEF)-like protein
MAAASILPFTLLLVAVYQVERFRYEPLVATGATIMLVLVLVQLVGLAVQLREQSEGERVMRLAVTEMAAAGERETVSEVLVAAVPRLVPPRADGMVAAVAENPGAAGPTHPGVPESDLVPVTNLPGPVARQLPGNEALVYPLCSGVSTGTPGPLTLYVSGGRSRLEKLRPRLDVLSSQACLVLDRIRLNREVVQRATEEYVRALAQTSGDTILIVDDGDRIRLASPPAAALFGPQRLTGARLPELVDAATRPAVADLLRRTRAGETLPSERGWAADESRRPGIVDAAATAELEDEGVNVAERSVRRPDGSVTTVEVACRRVKATDPAVHGLVVELRDVSEQRRLEAEVAARATRDSLTGLPTRQVFHDRLRQALEEAAGQNTCIGVAFLDLDGFRLINNRFGYEAGDTVLTTVAKRLSSSLPAGAMAARAGGDEFAILLETADAAAVDSAAARLLSAIAQPIEFDGEVIACTASAGVSTTTGPGTAAELSRQAEMALLAAQAAGTGHMHRYDPAVHSRVLDRLELRSELERALERDELTLLYQPIVDLTSGRTAGFEALLRWNHPTRGQLSPDAFIGAAEESGVIVAIGDWVLATALSEARRWARVAPDQPPFIGVNVSPRQFESPGFFGHVRRRLAETELPASRLHLEITEYLLLRDDDATWNELQRLRSLEVQIAIDDFGTGYSALSYLGRVPLDIVKLDRSFAHAITTTPQQRELVEGIVKLTEILKLSVVAEGIETEEQRAVMKDVGCHDGQGYLFARPMPAEAVLAWLRTDRDRARAVVAAD